jgi:hypothetical protein
VYDLRNLKPNLDTQNPGTDLKLPQNATDASKFNTESSTTSAKPTTVILENITEGEVVTSTEPEFFGKGPQGGTITITVHSADPVTQNLVVPQNGSWTWTPPTNLDPGPHTITIKWLDVSGITRSLTRNFVVQASEGPAFTASGSGSTPTPTPSIGATPSGSPTATPRATAIPRPSASASAEPIPVTGNATPTVLLSIIGIAIMIFSFAVWKIAEN